MVQPATKRLVTEKALTDAIAALLGGGAFTEAAQDAAAALFTSGGHTNITFTYDDAGNRIASVSAGGLSGRLPLAQAPVGMPYQYPQDGTWVTDASTNRPSVPPGVPVHWLVSVDPTNKQPGDLVTFVAAP